jgi:preprotein translocase subunit SecE
VSDAGITADEPDKGLVSDSRAVQKSDKDKGPAKRGLFGRIALFFRQTVAELRKVIWPTRKELISYTWIVLVFVVTMGIIIGILDFAFAKGVLKVFGG